MPEFFFRSLTSDGSENDGTCVATSEGAALRELSAKGLVVYEIGPVQARKAIPWYNREVSDVSAYGSK